MSQLPRTPIYIQNEDALDGIGHLDPVYYVLARNGLFIGRNVGLPGGWSVKSLSPAPQLPQELAQQETSLQLCYPRLDSASFQMILSYFRTVAAWWGAEAMVVLMLNDATGELELVVPNQVSTVSRTWSGSLFPIDLQYEFDPADLVGRRPIGDIHSHVYEAAYASARDVEDERHAPGLHVVIGKVDRDPPDIYVDFVIDRTRFEMSVEEVIEMPSSTVSSPEFPESWLDKIKIETLGSAGWGSSQAGSAGEGAIGYDR